LTADKIRVFPEIGFGGGDLNNSKAREVKRVTGVADAYGLLQAALDPESLGFRGDAVIGVAPEKNAVIIKSTKLTEGRLLALVTVTGQSLAAVSPGNSNLRQGMRLQLRANACSVPRP